MSNSYLGHEQKAGQTNQNAVSERAQDTPALRQYWVHEDLEQEREHAADTLNESDVGLREANAAVLHVCDAPQREHLFEDHPQEAEDGVAQARDNDHAIAQYFGHSPASITSCY